MQLNLWQRHWGYHFRTYFGCDPWEGRPFQIPPPDLSDIRQLGLIPLDLVCEKLQRTISSAIRSRFDSLLERLKVLGELHNLAYFDIYHMLRCIEVATAASSSLEVVLAAVATFLFGNREFTLVNPDYSAMRAAEALRGPCQALKILAFFKLSQLHTSITTSILLGSQLFLRRWNALASLSNQYIS